MEKQRLAIFASGNGSNAVRLVEYFKGHEYIEVAVLLTNNKNAGVIERLNKAELETIVINNEQAKNGELLIDLMNSNNINIIVLGGYLRKIPDALIAAFEEKIINIHPALLPKYGGKGMYGIHVHEAVKEANESTTGITIHLVNQNYDEGRVLAQHETTLSLSDEVSDIQRKIQRLEQKWFPIEVEKYIKEIKK